MVKPVVQGQQLKEMRMVTVKSTHVLRGKKPEQAVSPSASSPSSLEAEPRY
jgi:hypothetical protein